MIGEIFSTDPKSSYQPSSDIAHLTAIVKKEFSLGFNIIHKPWTELNERTIVDDENRGQMMFNAFVDTSVEDPNDAWKYRGTRSMARNKGIAMHANITQNFLLPTYVAQNQDDEIDRDFSEVMRDLIEWMAMPTASNYQQGFLEVTNGMLTNPVTFLGAEFYECYQKIKEYQEDGSLVTKEVIDDVLSGFQAPVYGATEILITNAFQRNIQKQRSIIQRRFLELEEAQAKYGDHPNWHYVKVGIKSIFNAEDGLFYDVKDNETAYRFLVIEETFKSRREDTEVCFLNGIYFGDMDNVDSNPMKHRDNFGAPKYNVVPFGYSRIGEHFFYYKSMMNVLGWDNAFYDAMTETVMNRAFLEVDQPLIGSGSEKIDSDVLFPKAIVTSESENFKLTPILPASNLGAGFSALAATEKSMSDETLSPLASGQMPGSRQTAYTIAAVMDAAKKIIGEVSKSLAGSMHMYGDLMKDIAINHITTPEVEEIIGGNLKLKFKTFFLENKVKGGRATTKSINFSADLIGLELSEEEKETAEAKMLEESGYPEEQDSLRLINPELFAKFKYLTRVDTEEMFKKNQEYWQPVLLNLKQVFANDPTIDMESLNREIMYSYFQSRGSDFIKKQSAIPPQNPQNPQNPTGQQNNGQGGVGGPMNQYGAIVHNKQLASRAAGVL